MKLSYEKTLVVLLEFFLKFPCLKYEYGLITNISNVVLNFRNLTLCYSKLHFYLLNFNKKKLNFTCETSDFRKKKKTLIRRNINIIFMQHFETKTIGNYKLIKIYYQQLKIRTHNKCSIILEGICI